MGPIVRLIPGMLREIRYHRANPRGHYFHRFQPGAKMYALGDGSVLLKGSRRLWADDREPGFWKRHGHRRENPMRRRRQRGGGIPWWVWLVGGVLLFTMRGPTAASVGAGQAPITWWIGKNTGQLLNAPGLLPPDGLGPVETAWRPASIWEIVTGGVFGPGF